MVQPQQLDPMIRERNRADLDVSDREYFGQDLGRFVNLNEFPFRDDAGTLTRQSYVFQLVYKQGSGKNATYGGIQLRARVHGYSPLPSEYRMILEESAHRAAHLFNSSTETPNYVNGSARGTDAGDGYLDGFNPLGVFKNWEKEPVAASEADIDPGVVDWSVEIYDETDFNHANLCGIAQGISNPYWVDTTDVEGKDPIHVTPHKWAIDTYDSRPDYYELRPPAHTGARDRYREGAGNGKTVYINGKYVGTVDGKGRVWLKKEYGSNDGHYFGSDPKKWSRKGLVKTDDDVYWQSLQKGATLNLMGETEDGVYLRTNQATPDDWKAGDPDSVPEDLRVREGTPGGTVHRLRFRDESEAFEIEGRRDDAITWALGMSHPPYSHYLHPADRWEPALEGDPNRDDWKGGGGR